MEDSMRCISLGWIYYDVTKGQGVKYRFLSHQHCPPPTVNLSLCTLCIGSEMSKLVHSTTDLCLSIQVLHFVHGERHKFVEVQILDDAKPEGPERFQLILSEPSPGLELGINTTGR